MLEREAAMSTSVPAAGDDGAPIVLVHGAWMNAGAWTHVRPGLEALGHDCEALDLPGAGIHARLPGSYQRRPLEIDEFASEPSPSVGITQEQRSLAVIDRMRRFDRPVVLVGHSLGGITVSDVVEAVPERVRAVVYLTAFMLRPGLSALSMIGHESMRKALTPTLLMADPQRVGALRIDWRSEKPDYRATLYASAYGGVGDDTFEQMRRTRHCDEPLGVVLRPARVTRERFGSVPRHYIRCLEDRAIPLEGQDHMIAALDSAIGGRTSEFSLSSGHSPFLSHARELVSLLHAISGLPADKARA